MSVIFRTLQQVPLESLAHLGELEVDGKIAI
jgi:hypothetical protein